MKRSLPDPAVIARFWNSQEYKTVLLLSAHENPIIIIVELHDRRYIGRVFIYDLMKLFIVAGTQELCFRIVNYTVSKPFLCQWFVNVNR